MREVRKEDLPGVQGGSDLSATIGNTLPYPVVPMPTVTQPGEPQFPPTLPEKHVEV